jgi:hypothetical protein
MHSSVFSRLNRTFRPFQSQLLPKRRLEYPSSDKMASAASSTEDHSTTQTHCTSITFRREKYPPDHGAPMDLISYLEFVIPISEMPETAEGTCELMNRNYENAREAANDASVSRTGMTLLEVAMSDAENRDTGYATRLIQDRDRNDVTVRE